MNKVILMGRLTRDPEVRYAGADNSMAIARYSLAVNRKVSKTAAADQPTADFISCVAFGKNAEFASKYLHKGTKILVVGHIQTGSYTNKDGQKVYTTDVVVEEQEFAESKGADGSGASAPQRQQTSGGRQANNWINVPDGIDEEMPFN